MKQNKKIGIGLLMMAMMVLIITGVQAAVVWQNPTTSGTLSGTESINMTSALTPLSNCTVAISSSASGDSGSVVAYNISGSGTELNATLDTTTLEDAADYVFAATCYNSTGDTETASATAVVVDNTVPQAPSSITPTTSSKKENVAISSTVTGVNTTACTVVLASSYHTETVSMTHSANTCTLTQTFPGSGDWTMTITATDGTNSTAASAASIKIEEAGGHIPYVPTAPTSTSGSSSSNQKMFYVLLLGVGVLIAYQKGWFHNKGKAPRRRRRKTSRRKRRKR